MHYEINVSRKGKHLFATHPRSLTDDAEANELFHEIARAFSDCEVTLSSHYTRITQHAICFDPNKD